MPNLALVPPPQAEAAHRPVMERAAEIFLSAIPDLTPAMLLAAVRSPLSAELASALAAVQARPLRSCVPS